MHAFMQIIQSRVVWECADRTNTRYIFFTIAWTIKWIFRFCDRYDLYIYIYLSGNIYIYLYINVCGITWLILYAISIQRHPFFQVQFALVGFFRFNLHPFIYIYLWCFFAMIATHRKFAMGCDHRKIPHRKYTRLAQIHFLVNHLQGSACLVFHYICS